MTGSPAILGRKSFTFAAPTMESLSTPSCDLAAGSQSCMINLANWLSTTSSLREAFGPRIFAPVAQLDRALQVDTEWKPIAKVTESPSCRHWQGNFLYPHVTSISAYPHAFPPLVFTRTAL